MNRYDDIIRLPHHVSAVHPQMSLHDRAAQFSPFAALTGHKEAVEETARLTWKEAIIDDNTIEELNQKLAFLKEHLKESGPVQITWFREDDRKDSRQHHDGHEPALLIGREESSEEQHHAKRYRQDQ